MIWLYAAAGLLGYAALLLFRDDASEHIRKWIFISLVVLGIGGGLYFAKPSLDDDSCTRYSNLAEDC